MWMARLSSTAATSALKADFIATIMTILGTPLVILLYRRRIETMRA